MVGAFGNHADKTFLNFIVLRFVLINEALKYVYLMLKLSKRRIKLTYLNSLS